jgi:hypothetical protein
MMMVLPSKVILPLWGEEARFDYDRVIVLPKFSSVQFRPEFAELQTEPMVRFENIAEL